MLIKAVLIGLILIGIGLKMFLRHRVHLHRCIPAWTCIMVTTGLAFMYFGWVNGGEGSLRVGTVFVIWPILYTLYIAGITRRTILYGLLKILVAATHVICLYFIYFAIHAIGWLPDVYYFDFEELGMNQGLRIGFHEGYIRANLHSFTTLLFTVPFAMASLLFWSKRSTYPIPRMFLWSAAGLGLAVILLSGRRGMWAAMCFSFLFAILLWIFSRPQSYDVRRIPYAIASLVLVFIAIFGVMFVGLDYDWYSVKIFFSEGMDEERSSQSLALLQGWSHNPIFGAGHGTSVENLGSVRAEGKNWMYEMFYLALLFQTGIVGFVIYSSGVVWIYWMGIKMLRSGSELGLYIAPVLVGTAAFLFATATNPYLGTYDYIWVIFLPIAFINEWLKESRSVNKDAPVKMST